MKKFLQIGSVLSVLALALAITVPASAESEKSAKGLEKALQAVQKAETKLSNNLEKAWKIGDNENSVMIRADGEFRVHGVKVNSVSASSSMLNVSLFGFSRDVNVAGAKLIGGGQAISLSEFKAGDVLAATGRFDAQAKAITVSEINNLSSRKDTSAIESRIEELLKMVRRLQEQLKNINR